MASTCGELRRDGVVCISHTLLPQQVAEARYADDIHPRHVSGSAAGKIVRHAVLVANAGGLRLAAGGGVGGAISDGGERQIHRATASPRHCAAIH